MKKNGYSHHPETLRWVGKLRALYNRHERLVIEMKQRGYNHSSSLDKRLAKGASTQRTYVNSPSEQRRLLKIKQCDCKL
jgi:hypothetical protein